ncbi:hypothetical protein [Sorangium sp. So ce1389]|uniref:hypothetical protein n=1 Tax=Sorangium sp. So ce1389 TaxID=3133336 RepID=UPI003F6433F2
MARSPILFVSGVEDLHEIAMRIGTPYMLRKPCDPDQLLSTLARAGGADRAKPAQRVTPEGVWPLAVPDRWVKVRRES